MKYILALSLLVASFAGNAQTDSSAQTLPYITRAKFAALFYPEGELKYEDYQLSLNLKLAMGSRTKIDSVSTITLKAGTIYKCIERGFGNAQLLGGYLLAQEFFTYTTAANGYAGFFEWVDYYIANGTADQKIGAKWLKSQVNDLIGRQYAAFWERVVNGSARSTNVITQN